MQLAVSTAEALPLLLRTASSAPRQPVTVGVALARAWCRDESVLGVFDADGRALPLQARPLDRWSDGSIRWALLDFQVGGRPGVSRLTLRRDSRGASAEVVAVSCDAAGARVDTGTTTWVISLNPFAVSATNGALPVLRAGLAVAFAAGEASWRGDSIEVESAGSLRAAVVVRGRMRHPSGPALDVSVRLTFYAGLAQVRADVTLRNPGRARHDGGLWELGDPGSILLRDGAFVVEREGAAPAPTDLWTSADAAPLHCDVPIELHQESSGGENWRSRAHLDRTNSVPLAFRGFRLRCGSETREGLRATPVVVAGRGTDTAIAVSVPQFWQNFPQAIESDGRVIAARFFPQQAGRSRPFELQGGEQKTHTIYAAAGRDASLDALDWTLRAPVVTLAPADWSAAGAALLPFPLPIHLEPAHQSLVDVGLDSEAGFFAKREAADEYGWRNFGDMPADHEAVRATPGTGFISHYNNQYDGVWGCWLQFMRSGDPRWRELACDLAAHVADIDVYHTSDDKSAYSHGLFWHTFHYVDAGLSTHRGYPKAPGVWGGGPSSEHNYTSGLTLQYFLTGDPRFRDVVLEMAGWVLAMDDGATTPLRWIYRGPTGLASATASADYHGPGRGAAYSINTLLNAHLLSGEPRYLAAAERLLRRCIHPRDDIGKRELLDAERRWSYTVFLQVLGRYLARKEELGQLDAAYFYARDSLVAYAAWMAAHETPYFERAESLEFVTETWVAQEFRKSDVFVVAARHAEGALREQCLERARFFYDYALRTLGSLPTRTLTRPLVLALSNGLLLPAIADGDLQPAAAPDARFDPGMPERFETQKAVAFRRAKWTAIIGAAACGGATALLWAHFH